MGVQLVSEVGLLELPNPPTQPLQVPNRTCTAKSLPPKFVGKVVIRDRKSTRLNSSHIQKSRMPSSA